MKLTSQLENFFMMLENGCITTDDERKQYCYYLLIMNETSFDVSSTAKVIASNLYDQVTIS